MCMEPIFFSRPNWMRPECKKGFENFKQLLKANDLQPRSIGTTDQPNVSPMDEVMQLMQQCSGAIVLGFSQTEVHTGKVVGDDIRAPLFLATEWNHIEAAIAHALELPLLVVHDATVKRGVFDHGAMNAFLHAVDFADESWGLNNQIDGALRSLRGRLRPASSAKWRSDLPEPTLQWGCYKFEGKEGLYCPACYENKNLLVPASRLQGGHYRCPSCKADLS